MERLERRPLPTFRIPEGDVTSLRKVYESDKWNGRKGYKEILDEAFKDFREKNPKEQLPDTFKDLLDKGEGSQPAKVFVGIITCANYILEDTICAEALIDRIDTGNYQKKNPALPKGITNRDIHNFFMDYGLEKAPKVLSDMSVIKKTDGGIKDKIAEVKLDSEMFINPGGAAEEMISSAETEEERQVAISLYKDLTEAGFKDLAKAIAAETGGKASDIINPKKRTPEQYDRLRRAVRKKISSRMETVYKSKFMQAIRDIQHKETKAKLSAATVSIIMNYAALYFFATHPEIDLRAKGEMDPKLKAEIARIYDRLLDFMEKERQAANRRKEFLSEWDAFMRFVEAEHPEEEERAQIKEIVQTVGHETKRALVTLDKVNSNVWADLQLSKPTFEQMQLNFGFSFEDHRDELPAIDTANKKNKGKGNNALILWGLRFDELPDGVKITKELTPYDRLCYEAIGSLYREATEEAGEKNVILTPTQIYKAMGYISKPPKTEIEKINASLQKLRAAIIYIDNTEEKKVNKKYPSFRYEGALLPWDRMTVYVNGKISKDGIRILAYPPLIDFAIGRNQIKPVPLEVYQFPISKSQQHLRIAQYLIEQICHMKNNPEYTRKLTFSTIFARCLLQKPPSWKQKNDAKEAIRKLLEYWGGKCAFIGKESRIEKEFIEIDLVGAKRLSSTRSTRKKLRGTTEI